MMLITLLVVFAIGSIHSATIDFKQGTTFIEHADFEGVKAFDEDGDGRQEIIVSPYADSLNTLNQGVLILKLDDDGQVSETKSVICSQGIELKNNIATGDFNNDQLTDIVVSTRNEYKILFQNSSSGYDTTAFIYSGNTIDGIEVGDLNSDGLDDFAISHWNEGLINVYYQTNTDSFDLQKIIVPQAGWDDLVIADLNQDEKDDILFAHGQGLHGTFYLIFQNDEKMDSTYLEYIHLGNERNHFDFVDVGDVNNDGINEIVGSFAENPDSVVIVHYDTLSKSIVIDQSIKAQSNSGPVALSDLNCDGKQEILEGNSGWGSVSVLESDENYLFSTYTNFKSAYYQNYPSNMAVGDFTGDFLPDFVTIYNSGIYFSINKTEVLDNTNCLDFRPESSSSDLSSSSSSDNVNIIEYAPLHSSKNLNLGVSEEFITLQTKNYSGVLQVYNLRGELLTEVLISGDKQVTLSKTSFSSNAKVIVVVKGQGQYMSQGVVVGR